MVAIHDALRSLRRPHYTRASGGASISQGSSSLVADPFGAHVYMTPSTDIALRINCNRVKRHELVRTFAWGWAAKGVHTFTRGDIEDADATSNSRRPQSRCSQF